MKNCTTLLVVMGLSLSCHSSFAQSTRMQTYCNPVNIDYTYKIYNTDDDISYRSGADPAVVRFRNEYYMFVTRSMGYWHSTDLNNWDFITPQRWYFQGTNAPAAHNYKDSVLYVAGDPSGSMSILYTDNPKKGDWQPVPYILTDLQDPDLFMDDNGQAYMFWGSSNLFPIRGRALDASQRFRPSKDIHALFNLDSKAHGWERFGENNSDTIRAGYIEGPWMTKFNGRYYLQYAAPGTEFNVYADGVYTSDSALGPYHYAPNNPVSFKPGGFINGAGHGSTVTGPEGKYWHFATMAVGVNSGWERRIGLFPAYFDKDGLMYCDTYFGDYPHYAPATPERMGAFTGWMLLSYKKPVRSSASLGGFPAENITDEKVKTYWVAQKNNDSQWVEIDLLKPSRVFAIQVNYNDYHSNLFGKVPGIYIRYEIKGSTDGKTWITLVDRSQDFKDVPDDYVELSSPEIVRYIRYQHPRVPTPWLSISDLRVFGTGPGKPPRGVHHFTIVRHADRRDATLTWDGLPDCQGYNVLWGIAPDKLYSSWMVYGGHSLEMSNLDTGQRYYFSIEAFNENGLSQRSPLTQVR